MEPKQVILFCNYTSRLTRSHLHLSDLKIGNAIRGLLGIPNLRYIDAAPWIEAFVHFFQARGREFDLHVVALQMGMKRIIEAYEEDGVFFHYVNSGLGPVSKLLDKLFGLQKKKGYPTYRRRFEIALQGVRPDLVMICGIENPDYAVAFLSDECPRKMAILQTLMNDPRRISMGVSTVFRREIENQVIKSTNYFAIPDVRWNQYIKTVNPNAICFPFTFPTIEPRVTRGTNWQFDFVFFAGILGRNKGINDVVSALSIVKQSYPDVSLNIIGSAGAEYLDDLHKQVHSEGLDNNITFTSSFPIRDDVFVQVIKSRFAVLPGITASLNSTVREAMLMGMPTIVYETSDTIIINHDSICLLAAKMESIDDLALKMIYALDNPEDMDIISKNGELYAKAHFSQTAFNSSFDCILNTIMNQ